MKYVFFSSVSFLYYICNCLDLYWEDTKGNLRRHTHPTFRGDWKDLGPEDYDGPPRL